ncbi:hypothetical protein ACLM5J_09265 [Nocardioides sp. Bht2]|uniref:hypothetical protein n=1 Tax=Nocardioides sp. Bht2 TaxID=3392297 RepID=UPI0039B6659E
MHTTTPAVLVVNDWAQQGKVEGAARGFAHHGLAITSTDEVLAFHAGQLVTFAPSGDLLRVSRPGLTEGHGITVVSEDGDDMVWVADPGFAIDCGTGTGDGKLPPTFGTGLDLEVRPGRVVKLSLDGEITLELPTPPSPDDSPGPFAPYAPTSVAVDEVGLGGTGDIWVADGYGSNAVHRYSSSGAHLQSLTGTEGAGRFDCPHAVFIHRVEGRDPEVYVADRGNARVAVYGLDGTFRRAIGDGFLTSPSGFARWGDLLVVVELFARLTLLDLNDHLVGRLGEDPEATDRVGWPNAHNGIGAARVPDALRPGVLNSPHAAAVNSRGELFVAEWVIGGRYTKFVRHQD